MTGETRQDPACHYRSCDRPVLITGGAGFIGTNLADHLASAGCPVLLFDNLVRRGGESNLSWLRRRHGDRVMVTIADVRDQEAVRRAVSRAGSIFHFAAQVAVTTSLADPIGDFEVNARGTLNVLEAFRRLPDPPPLIFTSTNKVYGRLGGLALAPRKERHVPLDARTATFGIDESQPLEFHSPYGCSKGTADQYVLDYARTFNLPAAVFRMSCIYGPHQWGNEDQGWVAHFLLRSLEGKPLTLYGDGRQVRDVLFVDDLVRALLLAREHMDRIRGKAFNIGGGPANAVSLLEVIGLLEKLGSAPPELRHGPVRTGDQEFYVSDTRAFAALTGWQPLVGVGEGVSRLHDWLLEVRPEAEGRRRRAGSP
jgi:CDP-paratose 2-epimerase